MNGFVMGWLVGRGGRLSGEGLIGISAWAGVSESGVLWRGAFWLCFRMMVMELTYLQMISTRILGRLRCGKYERTE
jgi:hypothetical protein